MLQIISFLPHLYSLINVLNHVTSLAGLLNHFLRRVGTWNQIINLSPVTEVQVLEMFGFLQE